jgi:hypothetical protein
MGRAGAAHAAHDLVQKEQDAVAIADLADFPEVSGRRRERARRRADQRLGAECGDAAGADAFELGFQFGGKPCGHAVVGFPASRPCTGSAAETWEKPVGSIGA